MLGSVKLRPGEQGGGVKGKKAASGGSSGSKAGAGRSTQSGLPPGWQIHHSSNSIGQSIDSAIRKQVASERRLQLPDWIQTGNKVGYVSKSSGKLCKVMVNKISREKSEVKIVFVEDPGVWKIIPFSMVQSPKNPLRPLSGGGGGVGTVTDLLDAAQASRVDKSVMLQRAVGAENSASAVATSAPSVPPRRPEPLVGSCTHKVIPDTSIAASSYFMNNKNYGFGQIWCTRIDCTSIGWRAGSDSPNQCLRWDFGAPKRVVKVQTKGSFVESHWVTAYNLSYSTDGTNWTRMDALFSGNHDQDSPEENTLDPPITASMLRLHPVSWHGHIGMRVEIFGHPASGEDPAEAGSGAPVDADRDRSRSPRGIGPVGPTLPAQEDEEEDPA